MGNKYSERDWMTIKKAIAVYAHSMIGAGDNERDLVARNRMGWPVDVHLLDDIKNANNEGLTQCISIRLNKKDFSRMIDSFCGGDDWPCSGFYPTYSMRSNPLSI